MYITGQIEDVLINRFCEVNIQSLFLPDGHPEYSPDEFKIGEVVRIHVGFAGVG
jgi:hypothetical protein